jgi:hypothetical protein
MHCHGRCIAANCMLWRVTLMLLKPILSAAKFINPNFWNSLRLVGCEFRPSRNRFDRTIMLLARALHQSTAAGIRRLITANNIDRTAFCARLTATRHYSFVAQEQVQNKPESIESELAELSQYFDASTAIREKSVVERWWPQYALTGGAQRAQPEECLAAYRTALDAELDESAIKTKLGKIPWNALLAYCTRALSQPCTHTIRALMGVSRIRFGSVHFGVRRKARPAGCDSVAGCALPPKRVRADFRRTFAAPR